MKLIYKILFVIIIICTILLQPKIIFAEGGDDNNYIYKVEDLETDYFDPNNETVKRDLNIQEELFEEKAAKVVEAIRKIGVTIAVIALMIIGVRQLISSAEEKSILKNAMPGYILGVILVVAITTLPSLIWNITLALRDK